MNTITKFIDDYLTRTGRTSIEPVEANALLAKAGILHDSKDRPGKPLRDLLRKGQLPHAFQSGGKGSSWTIPHSTKRAGTASNYARVEQRVKKVAPTKTETTTQVSSADTSLLAKVLMNEKNFKSAGDIDNLVPYGSGLYCIRIADINKLPKPFNTSLADRQHNIIYIGIASESLNRRF